MRILLIALAIISINACSFVGFPGVYKIDVEQGNIVTQEMADQLKPGMSRRQVRFILGTPLVTDPFNLDRWDYLYVKRNGLKVLSESRLTVKFDGDSLVTVTGDYMPPAWSDEDTSPAVDAPATDSPATEPNAPEQAGDAA